MFAGLCGGLSRLASTVVFWLIFGHNDGIPVRRISVRLRLEVGWGVGRPEHNTVDFEGTTSDM